MAFENSADLFIAKIR